MKIKIFNSWGRLSYSFNDVDFNPEKVKTITLKNGKELQVYVRCKNITIHDCCNSEQVSQIILMTEIPYNGDSVEVEVSELSLVNIELIDGNVLK